MTQLIWSNLYSCQFHRWARPAEKGPSLLKVILFVRNSTHGSLCPVLDFFQETGCHHGIGANGPGPYIGLALLLSQHTSPTLSQLLDVSKQSALLPEPASHQPGIATQLLHVLGKAARFSCQESQTPQTQTTRVPGPSLL